MKRILTTCVAMLCLMAQNIMAEDYSRYYTNLPVALTPVTEPVIPANTVELTAYGAVGDGQTDCTEAFNKAIADLKQKGGGHLHVPQGIWYTAPIEINKVDNLDLNLDKNAIVVFSEDKHLYIKDGKNKACACLQVTRCNNFSITGGGTLDGNGELWRAVKKNKVSEEELKQFKKLYHGGSMDSDKGIWYPYDSKDKSVNVADSREAQEKMRDGLVRINYCNNVLVKDVTFTNSPKLHFIPRGCKNLIIDNITVRCMWNAQNGDAMDISQCDGVLIVNSTVDCGDDGLCLKGGAGEKSLTDGPCQNLLIQDNTVLHGHGGFVVGSEFSAGIHNCVVRNNRFLGTDTGLRFKSGKGRGGEMSNVFCLNNVMVDIQKEAIIIESIYEDKATGGSATDGDDKTKFLPNFKDIHFEGNIVRGADKAMTITGIPEQYVHDITLKNNTFYTKSGMILKYAENVVMTDNNMTVQSTQPFTSVETKKIAYKGQVNGKNVNVK